MGVKFTKKELDLILILAYEQDLCRSGCVYPEMQTSKIDCDKCRFTKEVYSIINKIEEDECNG